MHTQSANSSRRHLRFWRAVAFGTIGCISVFQPSAAWGLDGGDRVMRIEEDWELRLNDPEPDVCAPQFHTTMSVNSGVGSYYFQVSWNYREDPDFSSGGLQLAAWRGDSQLAAKSSRDDAMSTYAETITWTQAMSTNGSVLSFQLQNGNSTTWGTFGGSGDTKLNGEIPLSNLNSYSPDVSAGQSLITFGSNRVNSLRIKEVRYYDSNGELIARDTRSRTIYSGSNGAGSNND